MSPSWFLKKALWNRQISSILSRSEAFIKNQVTIHCRKIFISVVWTKADPSDLDNRILRDFAQLMKKQNKWIEAIELWKVAAKKDDLISCVELAKYFEHREIDLFSASNWVETAINIVTRTDGTEKIMPELNHRKTRLESKIQIQ